jgi:hypothetical protein
MKKIVVSYVKQDIDNELRYTVSASYDNDKMNATVRKIQAVDGYMKVAEYEYDDRKDVLDNLEDAYRVMQNGVVTDSWTLEPPDGLTPLVEPHKLDGRDYGHRSASMGDVFSVDGKDYVVASFGFNEITYS